MDSENHPLSLSNGYWKFVQEGKGDGARTHQTHQPPIYLYL